ncbi:hypothetical protein ES703_08374 [subsurface metagenome]
MVPEDEISTAERLLFEIATYLRASAASATKSRAHEVLDDHGKAMVYKNLDGSRAQAKVAEAAGVSQATVSRYSQDFVEAGLATPPSKFYPNYRALFTLEELGIDISELKKRVQPKTKKRPPALEEATQE